MNVTQDINKRIDSYGGRPSSDPKYAATNRTLDFAAQGSNINQAVPEPVSIIPIGLGYKDTVGLFGVENVYIKLDLNIKNINFKEADLVENDYREAEVTAGPVLIINDYTDAESDPTDDTQVVNTYEPAQISNTLSNYPNPVVSIDLTNLKTGNKFIDTWFDVRLYNRQRIEHPYDRMYVKLDDVAYVGFHARNTKRLPYNVKVRVGDVFGDITDLTPDQLRYMA